LQSQNGWLSEKSGKWLGHYSRWVLDPATGEKKRQKKAFVIAPTKSMTKVEARAKLRERLVEECGLTSDRRITLKGFTESRWKPFWESRWRDSTKETNEELLERIYKRFGSVALEDIDAVQMQTWLDSLAFVPPWANKRRILVTSPVLNS